MDVAMAQGQTHDNVVVVRSQTAMINLYHDESFALVAITRHKKTFEYITTGGEDALTKLVKRGMEHHDEPHYYNQLNKSYMQAKRSHLLRRDYTN